MIGHTQEEHVSTSFVERQNLTMRMGMRCNTRLTNAFSKKVENHRAATAIPFLHYNFARIHQAIRWTPAIEAVIHCGDDAGMDSERSSDGKPWHLLRTYPIP